MKVKKMLLACGCCLVLTLSGPAWSRTSEKDIQHDIDGLLWNFPAQMLSLQWNRVPVAEIDRKLADVYRERESRPLWVAADGPGKEAETLLYLLRTADNEALVPADYSVFVIEQLWDQRSSDALALLDIALTSGLVAYANDLSRGRLRVREEDPELFSAAHGVAFEPKVIVNQALDAANLETYLRELAPNYPQYRKLRAALKQYRRIAGEGGWPLVDNGPTLRPGEEDARLPVIRERLLISGDLAGAADAVAESLLYDESLIAAVRQFQQRHGLAVDGVIGPATLAEMNVTTARRVRQIEMNMERWRWSDIDLAQEFVLVDIAGFRLYKVRDGDVVLEMPVIVGKQFHQTPVFSDRIKYIEFNPFWNVPTSIARDEMLPKLRENPGYLGTQRIRLFSGWGEGAHELSPHAIDWHGVSKSQMNGYKLRQDPGPWNALGTMKFVFPNDHSVYLHDTSSRNLFGRENRAFSHGCVRVGNPSGLAVSLLGGETAGWSQQKIDQIVKSGKRRIVNLPERVPVYITYQTAWIDRGGQLLFSRDIYERDARLAKALYEPPADKKIAASRRSPPAAPRREATPVSTPASAASSSPVPTPVPAVALPPVSSAPVAPPPLQAEQAPPPQPKKRRSTPGFHSSPDTR